MKKLRVLVFVGAALILLRQTPTVQAQYGQVVGCVYSSTDYPETIQCGSCCSTSSVTQFYQGNENYNPGLVGLVYHDPGSCGTVLQTSTCQISGATCGSTNEPYLTSVANAGPCCPNPGDSCVSGLCCAPETCFNGTCIDCVSYAGAAGRRRAVAKPPGTKTGLTPSLPPSPPQKPLTAIAELFCGPQAAVRQTFASGRPIPGERRTRLAMIEFGWRRDRSRGQTANDWRPLPVTD
jgi:hypothetical protein